MKITIESTEDVSLTRAERNLCTLNPNEAWAFFLALSHFRNDVKLEALNFASLDLTTSGSLEAAAAQYLVNLQVTDEMECAVEARLATFVGNAMFDGSFADLRAAWIKVFHARTYPAHHSVEVFDSLPLRQRVKGYQNPQSGTLLKPWVMTASELQSRFSF